ncbi:MAG: hypothetical protein EZS28_000433 [Streblomastix strix]|uniref:Uncharacterized protein n=1 Tax=Streblomastix strix TaxID=222440 RepID=A0A5J4XAA2_9EUKA|nr:MAG: hypothetical protein EZS28_000433 [Streblomastix strix]
MKLMLSVFRGSFTNQHNLVERNGFEDEDDIVVIHGATFRAYSVLHGLLQAGVPDKRLLFIRPPSDSDANSLSHERRIDAFENLFKRNYKDGDDEILK